MKHIETASLDNEAILFDPRSALVSCRRPEEKSGLTPIEGTSIGVGVFEDVQEASEPQVRIEAGEFFVVWGSESPRVRWFASPSAVEEVT